MGTAEQNILAIMCQDTSWETLRNGVEELEKEDFESPTCISIFLALQEIVKAGGIPTIGELSVRCPDVDRAELLNYLTEYGMVGEAFYNQYLREIRRNRVNRIVRRELPAIQKRVDMGEDGATDLLEKLTARIQTINTGSESLSLTDKTIEEAFYSVNDVKEKVRTGFIDLDKILGGGYGRGTLNAIGGRPSMGKSTLAMNVAVNVLLHPDRDNVVVYFTLEESAVAFIRRVLLHMAKCSDQQIINGDDPAIKRMVKAHDELYSVRDRFYVVNTPSPKVGKLSAICRKCKAKMKHIDLVVIDYLTLIDMDATRNKPLNQAIGDVTKALKGLAIELNVPVVLLCQLNRDSEKDGEPTMSSFKDSGNIEQDVDTAIVLYRPKSDEDVPQEWNDEEERRIPPNLKVVKNRDGGYGTIPLAWLPSSYTFSCVYKGEDRR